MLKFEAVPIPNSMLMPVVSVTVGNTMFVAAFPSMPTTWPMKIWSVMLYTAPTSMLMIEGMAYLAISGSRGALPSGLFATCLSISLLP